MAYAISIEPVSDDITRDAVVSDGGFSGRNVLDINLSRGTAGDLETAKRMAEFSCCEYDRRLEANRILSEAKRRLRLLYSYEVPVESR